MRLAKANPGSVVAPAALTLSKALHDGKTVMTEVLTGTTIVLPAAIGSGMKVRIFSRVAPTSNSDIIKVQNAVDTFIGGIAVSGTTTAMFPAAATAGADTITLNRTTTGAAFNGGILDLEDIRPGSWAVRGFVHGSGAVATPFSATVS